MRQSSQHYIHINNIPNTLPSVDIDFATYLFKTDSSNVASIEMSLYDTSIIHVIHCIMNTLTHVNNGHVSYSTRTMIKYWSYKCLKVQYQLAIVINCMLSCHTTS